MRAGNIAFIGFACFVLGSMFMVTSIRPDRAEANITARIVSDNITDCEPEIIYINSTKTVHDVTEPPWETYLKNFSATHEYHESNYNCNDFTRDAVSDLRDMGIRVRQVIGKCDWTKGGLHTWVEVCEWWDLTKYNDTAVQIEPGECYENA